MLGKNDPNDVAEGPRMSTPDPPAPTSTQPAWGPALTTAMSTWPEAVGIGPTDVQAPVVGDQISAELAPQVLAVHPPATSTRPSGRRAAPCNIRPVTIGPVAVQVFAAGS